MTDRHDKTDAQADAHGVPRWVKILGIGVLIVALVAIVVMLLGRGGGGGHGPSRHSSMGDEALPGLHVVAAAAALRS